MPPKGAFFCEIASTNNSNSRFISMFSEKNQLIDFMVNFQLPIWLLDGSSRRFFFFEGWYYRVTLPGS